MDGGPLLPSSTTTYNSAQFGNENRGVQVQGGSENTYNINYSGMLLLLSLHMSFANRF